MYAELIIGDELFQVLADDWDALAQRGMTDTPFQSLAYQESWWKNLQPLGSELHSIITRSDTHQLMAIACLYITDEGVVHFNGCVEETDYLDLIAEARHAEQAWGMILNCLLSDDYPRWRLLELCNVPAISPTRTILPRLSEDLKQFVIESINEVCPIIQLPNSFDIYLQSLDSKQRREIKRKLRRAEGSGVELQIIDKQKELNQAVTDFLYLLQMSTFEKRDWLNEGRRALFYTVAEAAHKSDSLQLMFLVIDGRRAAALFNFDYRNRIWVYNSGLDPDSFGNLSLGVVLTAKAIEWAIENGRTEFDFLRAARLINTVSAQKIKPYFDCKSRATK